MKCTYGAELEEKWRGTLHICQPPSSYLTVSSYSLTRYLRAWFSVQRETRPSSFFSFFNFLFFFPLFSSLEKRAGIISFTSLCIFNSFLTWLLFFFLPVTQSLLVNSSTVYERIINLRRFCDFFIVHGYMKQLKKKTLDEKKIVV